MKKGSKFFCANFQRQEELFKLVNIYMYISKLACLKEYKRESKLDKKK